MNLIIVHSVSVIERDSCSKQGPFTVGGSARGLGASRASGGGCRGYENVAEVVFVAWIDEGSEGGDVGHLLSYTGTQIQDMNGER